METFEHEVRIVKHEGTHYDIGKEIGERVKREYPDYIKSALEEMGKAAPLYLGLGMQLDLTPEYIDHVFPKVEGIIERVHPELLDEIRGFANGLEEDYRRVLAFTSNFGPGPGCSQFFINGYLARNYDDAPTSVENQFAFTKPVGSYLSIGSTSAYLERLDGMNEKGLAASLTFGAGYPAQENGIGAAMFIRIVLDKAATIDEALDIFQSAPYISPNNVLLADTSGKSIIIEVSGKNHRVREGGDSAIYCANSYLHPEMRQYQKLNNLTTKWRENKIDGSMKNLSSSQEIMTLLTQDFPNGLFEPYFDDGLGTLWSVVYNPSTKEIWLGIGEEGLKVERVHFKLTDPSAFDRITKSLKVPMKNVPIARRIKDFRSN